jgi:hypothetical protein
METIINLVKDNWVEVLAIIGAIDIILGIVVKWTPTQIDDNVYTFLHNLISKLVKK